MKATLTAGNAAHRLARLLWLGLVVLCVAWELWFAPLRPGGSWLVLKALPAAVLLPAVWRGDVKRMQIALLVVLLYVAEATVRIVDPAPVAQWASAELALSVAFFGAAIAYLAPLKRAARARRRGEEP